MLEVIFLKVSRDVAVVENEKHKRYILGPDAAFNGLDKANTLV